MPVIDAAHIQSLTKQLDEAVPREGHVEVVQDPNDLDYTLVRANQLGYLRLGIEFLKAAYAPPESGGKGTLLRLDLKYLEGFEHQFYSFERREDVWSPIWSEEPASTISQIVGVLFGFFFVASFLIGAFRIFEWLFKAVF
jgi:hypothetical protein